MTAPAVKICGLQRREDALLAAELGAAYLGVILTPGFGRSLATARAREVVEGAGPAAVGVFVDEPPETVVSRARESGVDVVQLHGEETPEAARRIAGEGGWRVWKGVRVDTAERLRAAVEAFEGLVEGFLVEGRIEGVLGGGGARLNADPAAVRAALPKGTLFLLAGGLTPDNVQQAAARFLPDVVDVSSGVESMAGSKDPDLLRHFFSSLRSTLPEPEIDGK